MALPQVTRASEGDSDEAFALFTFDSFAAYEKYREWMFQDPDCLATLDFAAQGGFIKRYERRFLSLLFA